MSAMSFIRNTNAAAAVYFALVLPFLLTGLALSVDIGFAVFKRHDVQKMADIGAIAAFSERLSGGSIQSQKLAACKVIELAGSSCQIYDVAVYSPPVAGKFIGESAYLQVEVSHTSVPFFASLLLDNDIVIAERAVVGGSEPSTVGQCCLCSLNTSASTTTEVKGTATLELDACGIATNSSSPDALKLSGNVNVTASCIYSYGPIIDPSDLPTGVTLQDCTVPIQLDAYIVDPYEGGIDNYSSKINWVTEFGSCTAPNLDLIELHRCSSPQCGEIGLDCTVFKPQKRKNKLNFPTDEIRLPPGLYILDGVDLVMTSKQVLTGSEITIILMHGSSISITGGQLGTSTEPLSARSEAPFKGVLFGELGPNQVTHKFAGNETSSFTGALYLPSSSLEIAGASESTEAICTQIIADTLTVTGKASFAIDNCETGSTGILETVNLQKSSGQSLVE